MAEFVRSLAAQGAAKCIIDTASALSLISGPISVAPRLAEAEKELMIKMLKSMHERFNDNPGKLEPDEVSSLFTFVFAKSAEAVTNMYNKQADKFELTGMLDGRIPVYADEKIMEEFKSSEFPFRCAENYLAWSDANSAALMNTDPVLTLFEALKWCFRFGCHRAIIIVEAARNS